MIIRKEILCFAMRIQCRYCETITTIHRFVIPQLIEYKLELFNKQLREFEKIHKECGVDPLITEISESYQNKINGNVFLGNERIIHSHIIQAVRQEAAKQMEEDKEWTETMLKYI